MDIMTSHNHSEPENKKIRIIKTLEIIIFGSRWVLIPFCLILLCSLIIYAVFDIKEFFHYLKELGYETKEGAMLEFIGMVDMTLIAYLGKMIITGGYNSYVSKNHGYIWEKICS